MKTIICDSPDVAVNGAEIIVKTIQKKPTAVLALACGKTMYPLWEQLVKLYNQEKLCFSQTHILCVTEYVSVAESKSCRWAIENGLLKNTDVKFENFHVPDPNSPESYDDLIHSLGGIDLAVLGIGENCHIGYNEPGTLFNTCTHVQKLTDRTKRQLLKRGFTEKDIPQTAVTMGIKTLSKAKGILLLAEGKDKAGAVYQMIYAKTTPYVPAAYLQIPLEVTAILDAEAAKEL